MRNALSMIAILFLLATGCRDVNQEPLSFRLLVDERYPTASHEARHFAYEVNRETDTLTNAELQIVRDFALNEVRRRANPKVAAVVFCAKTDDTENFEGSVADFLDACDCYDKYLAQCQLTSRKEYNDYELIFRAGKGNWLHTVDMDTTFLPEQLADFKW